MKDQRRLSIDRPVWCHLLVVFIIIYVLFQFCSLPANAYPWDPMMCSFEKEIPIGFSEEYMLPPNVLLLIDTSGSMTFIPGHDGESEGGWTLGDGSRPLCVKEVNGNWRGGNDAIYFGKDMYSSNNDPEDINNYHPLLTYINDDLSDINPDIDDLSSVITVTQDIFSGLSNKDSYFASDSNGNYLYPNDSRMYQLKLVLWRIFNNYSLISNLRIGLSTFYQDRDWNESDWYEWEPERDTDRQNITWEGSSSWSFADLKVEFGNTQDTDHLNELKQWFDGIETYYQDGGYQNDELRADGHTPLAYSITNSSNGSDCALDYFADQDVIQGWCQENWLIILSDGADTAVSPTSERASEPYVRVKSLYDQSSNWYFRVNNKNISIQPVKTLVIGLIDPDSTDPDIIELKTTLNQMADYGDDGIDNDSQEAYFANDVASLLTAFESIFTTIQEKKGSGSAPLISPGSRVSGDTASVYVAPFLPDSDGDGQWEGYLEKYSLVDGVIPDTPDWDAGQILDSVLYSDRSIYTVDWNSSSNLVDFSRDNISSLKQLIFDKPNLYDRERSNQEDEYSLEDWADFIDWVRGSADSGSGERWKLGDIYHSGLVEVGAPQGNNPLSSYVSFSTENVSRDELLYVQANDGMLHAFNSNDNNEGEAGSERWAFVPPNVLYAGKLVGLKGNYDLRGRHEKWLDFNHSDTGVSVPRYMLDGPIVVEDVFDENEGESGSWKTILLAELGYAGAGMYAIDVTDPDSPEFLWAIDNAIYYNNEEPEVYLGWDSSNGKTLSNESSFVCYWNTGQSESVSFDVYSHNDESIPSDLDYRDLQFTLSVPAIGSIMMPDQNEAEEKWVALMGNGTNMGITGGGNENTGTLYVIDILTGKILKIITKDDLPSANMKQVVTPVSVLKTNNSQRIEKFYFGDDDGTVTEITAGEVWSYRTIINVQGASGLSYGIELGSFNGDTWLFFMTGDLDPKVVKESNNDYFVACNADNPEVPFESNNKLSLIDPSDPESLSSASDPGWYFELTGSPVTPPKLYGGYIFLSTFVENEEDLCEVGDSRLYVLDALTGMGAWENSSEENVKYIDLAGVQISGITITDGKVYIGAIGHEGQGTETLPEELGGLNPSFDNNLLVFDVPDVVGSGGNINIESGQMIPRYWREWIRR